MERPNPPLATAARRTRHARRARRTLPTATGGIKPRGGGLLRRSIRLAALPALALVLLAALWVGVAFGTVPLPLGGTLRALLGEPVPSLTRLIIWDLRLPRVLVAGGVGMALAVAGCVLQGIFRNPMADPAVLGVSAGSGLGAVIAIYAGWAAQSPWSVPSVAFVGALVTAATVYGLATRSGRTPVETLLLAGIAVASLLSAAIGLVMTLAREAAMQQMVFWLMGGLDGETWSRAAIALPPIVAGTALACLFARELNILVTGEEAARGVGVPVEASKRLLLCLCALVTAAAVSVSGVIGFVGLIVPHMLRLVVGPDHRLLLPASALGGGAFLILADLVSRLIFRPAELSVGVLTAFLGVPFFLYLLRARWGAVSV